MEPGHFDREVGVNVRITGWRCGVGQVQRQRTPHRGAGVETPFADFPRHLAYLSRQATTYGDLSSGTAAYVMAPSAGVQAANSGLQARCRTGLRAAG